MWARGRVVRGWGSTPGPTFGFEVCPRGRHRGLEAGEAKAGGCEQGSGRRELVEAPWNTLPAPQHFTPHCQLPIIAFGIGSRRPHSLPPSPSSSPLFFSSLLLVPKPAQFFPPQDLCTGCPLWWGSSSRLLLGSFGSELRGHLLLGGFPDLPSRRERRKEREFGGRGVAVSGDLDHCGQPWRVVVRAARWPGHGAGRSGGRGGGQVQVCCGVGGGGEETT